MLKATAVSLSLLNHVMSTDYAWVLWPYTTVNEPIVNDIFADRGV